MAERPSVGGLVLTRRVGEAIYVGRDIVVSVLAMGSGHVKLHITGPKDLAISRAEFTFESHLQHCERREQGGTR